MTTFTPGPWIAKIETTNSGWESPKQWVSVTAEETVIAHYATNFVEYPDTDEVNAANAHLIAAAPDLYAALEEITQRAGARWFLEQNWAAPLDALARARGEQP